MSSSEATLEACTGILAVLGVAESRVNALAVSGLSFAAQVRVRQAAGGAAAMPVDLLGRAHLVDRMAALAQKGVPHTAHPITDENTDEVLAAVLTAQEEPPLDEVAPEPQPVPEPSPALVLGASVPPGPTTDEVDSLVSFGTDELVPLEDESELISIEADPLSVIPDPAPRAAAQPEDQWEMTDTMTEGVPVALDDLVSFDPADAAAALVSFDDLVDIDEDADLESVEVEPLEELEELEEVPEDEGPTNRRTRPTLEAAANAESDGEIDLFGTASSLVSFDEEPEAEEEEEEVSAVVDDLSALQDLIGFDDDQPTLEAVDGDDLEDDTLIMETPIGATSPLVSFEASDDDYDDLDVEAFEDNEGLVEISEDIEELEELEELDEDALGDPEPTDELDPATMATPAGASVRTVLPTARVAAAPIDDDLGVAIIRDHSESRPRAAAAAIQLGPGGSSKVLGLKEEEEPIELAAAEEDDEDYDSVGGFALDVEEEEYDEEEEEAVPQLTDDDVEDEQAVEGNADSNITAAELQAIRTKAVEASQTSISDAVTYWSDYLDLAPEDLSAHVARGRLYLDLSDYSRAMSDFQRAESLEPDSPEPLVATGDLFFNRKDYARAIDYFNQALKIAPEHAMAYCRRGISHYYRKNYVDALDDLQKAEALNDEIPNIGTYVDMAKKKAKRRR